jgi:hypothetical protein
MKRPLTKREIKSEAQAFYLSMAIALFLTIISLPGVTRQAEYTAYGKNFVRDFTRECPTLAPGMDSLSCNCLADYIKTSQPGYIADLRSGNADRIANGFFRALAFSGCDTGKAMNECFAGLKRHYPTSAQKLYCECRLGITKQNNQSFLSANAGLPLFQDGRPTQALIDHTMQTTTMAERECRKHIEN